MLGCAGNHVHNELRMQLAVASYPIFDQTNEGTKTAPILLSMISIDATPFPDILSPWIHQLIPAQVELN